MTEGKVPALGFTAASIGFVVLLGFSPLAPGPSPTADVIVQVQADPGVIQVQADVGVIRVQADVGTVQP